MLLPFQFNENNNNVQLFSAANPLLLKSDGSFPGIQKYFLND